jgi:hypothetical protein
MPMPQITIRKLMAVVAIAALISLVASNAYRHGGITDKRIVIPVACLVSAVYGIGAVRRPLVVLMPLLVVWIVTPAVDHPAPDVIHASAGGCFLAWFIGAPVGWLSRCFSLAMKHRAIALGLDRVRSDKPLGYRDSELGG